jgi:hypothetical protein
VKYSFEDHTAKILRADPTLDNETRAQLWDSVNSAQSPEHLVRQLHAYDNVSPDLKSALVDAYQRSQPVPESALERTLDALNRLRDVDPVALDQAESHPKVATAIINTLGAHAVEPTPQDADNETLP